jgi:hypothetical protein
VSGEREHYEWKPPLARTQSPATSCQQQSQLLSPHIKRLVNYDSSAALSGGIGGYFCQASRRRQLVARRIGFIIFLPLIAHMQSHTGVAFHLGQAQINILFDIFYRAKNDSQFPFWTDNLYLRQIANNCAQM